MRRDSCVERGDGAADDLRDVTVVSGFPPISDSVVRTIVGACKSACARACVVRTITRTRSRARLPSLEHPAGARTTVSTVSSKIAE